MIRLNIIPENQKKTVKTKFINDHLKTFLEFLFIVAILFAILFLLMKLALANHFVTTIRNTTLLTKSTENYSRKIADINNKLANVEYIQNNFIRWSILIEQIRNSQSDGISLDRINVNKKDNKISLDGAALTRDELLEFKEKIEDLGYFKEINIPIKTLLQKENLKFSISIEIVSYE